ncbi:MAG: hypothetical protein RR236_03120 [Raoultibacter sp.]
MRDASGKVLSVETINLTYVLPSEKHVVACSLQGDGLDVATIEYSASVKKNSWEKINSETVHVSDFAISGQSEQNSAYSKSWVGEITNNSGADYEGFTSYVVLKNQGKIVTGFIGYGYDTPLPRGVATPFEIKSAVIGETQPIYDSYEIYIYPKLI